MIPTLLVGDFILVDKNTYGIRLPLINKKIIQRQNPERGDVVVFRYPNDPSTPFIKRAVGLPGDTIEYREKTLIVNGEKMPQTAGILLVGQRAAALHTGAIVADEELDGQSHHILRTRRIPYTTHQTVVHPGN